MELFSKNKEKINQVKKTITNYCLNTGKIYLLKSVQDISVDDNLITIKTHSKGEWIGKDGRHINHIRKALHSDLCEILGEGFKMNIENADVWYY